MGDAPYQADVVTNNFRAGTLPKMGLTYERCKAWNPLIIYTSNSGFGEKGEWAHRASFDGIAQAFTGVTTAQAGGPSPARGHCTAIAESRLQ